MKSFVRVMSSAIFALLLSNTTVFAHPADPTGELAKYSIYGADLVWMFDQVKTADGDATGGWVGSESEIRVYPGNIQANGPVYSNGPMNFSPASWNDVFNDRVEASAYSGESGATFSAGRGNAVSTTPSFPSYVVSKGTENCTVSGGNWSCDGTSGGSDVLPAGRYDAVTIPSGASAKFGEGVYEIGTLTFVGGSDLIVAKSAGEFTRILVKDGVSFTSGVTPNFPVAGTSSGIGSNNSIFLADTAGQLGSVLLYYEGTQTTYLSDDSEFSMSFVAPNSKIVAETKTQLFGQLLAKSIDLHTAFDGPLGAFVGFNPSGVSLVGADAFNITEAGGTRLIPIPVELGTATTVAGSVNYSFEQFLGSEYWVTGADASKTPAILSGTIASSDIAFANDSASAQNGTLQFSIGNSSPDDTLKLIVNDDALPEPDVGGLEYFTLILTQPTGLIFEDDADAAYVSAAKDTLIYLIPIVSDDVLNQVPNTITASRSSLTERTRQNINLSATDPDGDDSNISFSIVSGFDGALFEQVNDTRIRLVDLAVFENSSGVLSDDTLDVNILATDEDGGTSTQLFKFVISNANDESPQAIEDVLSLNEGATASVDVTLNDTDSIDGLSLSGETIDTIGILGGAKYATSVTITGTSIEYVHDGSENFTDTVYYELNDGGVVAANQTSSSFIVVSITPLNDNQPVLNTDTLSTEEGQPNGTVVDTLNITDTDGNSVSVSISDQKYTGAFEVIEDSIIRVANTTLIDYETDSLHFVELTLNDGGTPVIDTVWIKITNVNDNAPEIDPITLSIEENSPNGTSVGTIVGRDLDGDALVYSIESQSPSGAFSINSTTGEIQVNDVNQLNYELNPTHSVTVGLTAGGQLVTRVVTVNIINLNDNDPTLVNFSLTIPENTSNDSIISILAGNDLDGGALTYGLVSQDSVGAFSVDASGELRVNDNTKLDFETNPIHTVTVRVLDTSSRTGTAVVTINLSNVNDNTPILDSLQFTIAENAPEGAEVGTLIATDADGDALTYSILSQQFDDAFSITSAGLITVNDTNDIDFETATLHLLTIQVTDGDFTITTNITVAITNANDGTPIFTNTTMSIDENPNNSAIVGTHTGVDPDGNPLIYSIDNQSNSGMFVIDSLTAEISVLDSTLIDFETNTSDTLRVMAFDGVDSAFALIVINFNNINDNAPNTDAVSFDLDENSADGTSVGTLSATDADGTLNPLGFTLDSAEYAGAFVVDAAGNITVSDSSLLDYEVDSSHTLYITVSDGTFTDSEIITINLRNLNDSSPVYNDTLMTIAEGLSNGTSLGFHLASDNDGGVLSYSIGTQSISGTFNVSTSGEITINNSTNLDFETQDTLTFEMIVNDSVFSDTAIVTIVLTNENDEAPIFADASYTVSETDPNGFLIGNLIATDDGSTLTFTIDSTNNTGAYSVSTTGALTILDSVLVDYESSPVDTLYVTVNDGVDSTQAMIILNVTNENDNTPSASNSTFSVTEGDSSGTFVGQVIATDADNDSLSYTIISQDYPNAFEIDSLGNITVDDASLIDFEVAQLHNLVVSISDGINNTNIDVVVNVVGINDNAPVLDSANFTIAENFPEGNVVGDLVYSDADNSPLTFSILNQDHPGTFGVNTSGQIILLISDSIDFELYQVHNIEVIVSDPNFSDTANVVVNITNVNDNDPSFGNIVFTISEDVNNGDTVGVHTATDSDGNTITYEIQTQDVTGMFSYDSNGTVIIADNSQIDFDTDARHDMNVLAISEGDTVAAIITVLLTDVNDNLPILVGDTIEVSEEVSIDFVLFNLMGTDQDRDDIFTYEIESGNTNSDFKLVNDSELSVGNDLVYTRDSIYDLTVLGITNSDTARAQFVIKVIDVNVRPVITVDSLFIEENTLSGDLVSGTLIGVDEDSTQVIWSLEDTTLFVIDSLTGQISVRVDSTLNFETQGTVPVTIVASDDSSSAVRTVFITLINVNDAPVIQSSTLTVEENTSSGTIIGRVDAEDEDFDAVLTYEIVGGEIFTIDSTTGDIILREGESIDFEDQESYTFEVIVSDGEYSDTTEITIDIENIVETATISVVEIFDDSGRSVENTQEFYTSHDSVTIVYNKDGVLDSIRYSVDEGINIINEINNDPTKDIFEDVDVKIVVSKVDPEFEVVVTPEIPVDTTDLTHHINDLEQDSIWVRITHVNQGLDTVYIDSLLAIDDFLVEGEVHEKVVVFEDVYGNVDSTTVRILLDTTFPILTILNPENRSETDTLLLNVIWEVVDGTAIDTLTDQQLVSSGTFAIIRSYSDFAGNVAADTVIVTVTADDTGAKIAVIDDVVNQKTTDELIEYFEERERSSDPAFDGVTLDTDGDGIPDIERANISVIMPHQSSNNNGLTTAIELAVQTDKGVIRREEEAEFVYDVKESKFGLNLELNFPINGGYTQDGRSRAGTIPDSLKSLCDPDSTMFTLRVERIQFHIFDHIGQYVSKINIDGFDVSDPRYQNDNGKVNLMMEIPQLADGLTSEAGDNWGTGVYIMSGVVQTSSTPKECLQDIDTLRRRTSSTSLMEEVGYKRENP